MYDYAGNNPVKYTDPNGMEDDIPSFEELNKQYEETLNKFLRLCDISDNFSNTTSLITAGKNKIEDVLSGIVMSESYKNQNDEQSENLQKLDSVKNDLGAISAFAIKKYGSSHAKIGVALIKIGLVGKRLEYQIELNKIEKEMEKNYPDQYENKIHPVHKFSGGGAIASW